MQFAVAEGREGGDPWQNVLIALPLHATSRSDRGERQVMRDTVCADEASRRRERTAAAERLR